MRKLFNAVCLLACCALAEAAPNFVIILADDLGYSDIGCYGGEIRTPNLDALAANGMRIRRFYNTSKCWTSRASLLTGRYWQSVTVGNGLRRSAPTVAEMLAAAGYRTYLSGKWHLDENQHDDPTRFPTAFGFHRYFGNLHGAVSYYNPYTLMRGTEPASSEIGDDFYLTDAISDDAVSNIRNHTNDHSAKPFFHYVAYTAPHWPLHAREEDIAEYEPFYREHGFDDIRATRFANMRRLGILPTHANLSDATHPEWSAVDQTWFARRMAVYAAMITSMDRGIGRIVSALKESRQLEDTVICFLSDNGACAENIGLANGINCLGGKAATRDGKPIQVGLAPGVMPGGEETFQGYGPEWANVSAAPYRWWKATSHEGGIRTPFVVHWPAGMSAAVRGSINSTAIGHIIDFAPTMLDLAGVARPSQVAGKEVAPLDGIVLSDVLCGEEHHSPPRVLHNEFGKGRALYDHPWKLVSIGKKEFKWELYRLDEDPTETNDLAASEPDQLRAMIEQFKNWQGSFEFADNK